MNDDIDFFYGNQNYNIVLMNDYQYFFKIKQ